MEAQAYTTGGRFDDRGDYTIPVTLSHGDHHMKAIGYQGGWSAGNFWELEVRHYMIQPLVELYGGCMVVLKVA